MANDPADDAPAAGIALRQLAAGDLALLRAWLSEGPALHWYAGGTPPTTAEIARKYLPRIRGEVPVHGHILLMDGMAAGYFQHYLLRDFPDHPAAALALSDTGIDVLLAPDRIGHGLGPPALRRFALLALAQTPGAAAVWADPHPKNLRSRRALRHAGFGEVRVLDTAVLLRLPRAQAPQGANGA